MILILSCSQNVEGRNVRVDILRLGDLGDVKRKKESIQLAKDDTS